MTAPAPLPEPTTTDPRAVAIRVAAAMWDRQPLALLVAREGQPTGSSELNAALLAIARQRSIGWRPLTSEVDALLAEVAVAAGLVEREPEVDR